MKNFLIHYAPGARGDFLANVLKHTFNNIDPYHFKLAAPQGYVKVHTIEHIFSTIPNFNTNIKSYDQLFLLAKEYNLPTIRIILEEDDLLDMMLLRIFKNSIHKNCFKLEDISELWLSYSPRMNKVVDAINFIREIEKKDIEYRSYYDYIVNFKDLFDIEFLSNFYSKINGDNMHEIVLSKIQTNIDIQNTFLTEVKYKYEQTYRNSDY